MGAVAKNGPISQATTLAGRTRAGREPRASAASSPSRIYSDRRPLTRWGYHRALQLQAGSADLASAPVGPIVHLEARQRNWGRGTGGDRAPCRPRTPGYPCSQSRQVVGGGRQRRAEWAWQAEKIGAGPKPRAEKLLPCASARRPAPVTAQAARRAPLHHRISLLCCGQPESLSEEGSAKH